MRRYLLGAVSGAALVAAVVSFPRAEAGPDCAGLKARVAMLEKEGEGIQERIATALKHGMSETAALAIQHMADSRVEARAARVAAKACGTTTASLRR